MTISFNKNFLKVFFLVFLNTALDLNQLINTFSKLNEVLSLIISKLIKFEIDLLVDE